jgi:hypothetical protein
MKKRNAFDSLMLLFVFTVAYLLGIHSAMPKEPDRTETVTLSVRHHGDTSQISVGDECHDPSGTRMRVIFISDDEIRMLCDGVFCNAGFLSSGGKYLCANQPISLSFDQTELCGRILSLFRGSS